MESLNYVLLKNLGLKLVFLLLESECCTNSYCETCNCNANACYTSLR